MVAMTTDKLPEWVILDDALEIVARHVGKTSNIFVYIKQDMTEAAAPPREVEGWPIIEDAILALVAGPHNSHHKMNETQEREAKAFNRCRDLTLDRIRLYFEARRVAALTHPQGANDA